MTVRPSTALQLSLTAVFQALDAAHVELDAGEYQVLLDIVAVRLVHDYLTRIGLLANDDDEAAA